jgi:hypothetical protein
VEIPGATQGLVRIATINGRLLRATGGHLRLGYEDDDYSDNGSYDHDDGTGDQCKNIGPAWVIATIVSSGLSAIDQKYSELDDGHGFLGQPTIDENTTPDGIGRYRHYQNGSIYWSPQTGAHEVHGLIRAKWTRLGWEKSFLGYPVTDETKVPDNTGSYNHFQNGSIYWKGGTNEAFEIHGDIRAKWAELGWERNVLGYPLTDETSGSTLEVRFNKFERGAIYWIYEPNVKSYITDYTDVPIPVGARVVLDAHGCVQTGGLGQTWKLYVDPSGPNSDRLYHGLAWIPGAGTNECLARIENIGPGRDLWVSPHSGQSFLRLGYEDDNYPDNGYWGFDEGTDHQCLNQSHATVMLMVENKPSSPPNPLPRSAAQCAPQPQPTTGGPPPPPDQLTGAFWFDLLGVPSPSTEVSVTFQGRWESGSATSGNTSFSTVRMKAVGGIGPYFVPFSVSGLKPGTWLVTGQAVGVSGPQSCSTQVPGDVEINVSGGGSRPPCARP